MSIDYSFDILVNLEKKILTEIIPTIPKVIISLGYCNVSMGPSIQDHINANNITQWLFFVYFYRNL